MIEIGKYIKFKKRYTRHKKVVCEKWSEPFLITPRIYINVLLAKQSGMECEIVEMEK